MGSATVKTRILIISDTHCAPLKEASETNPTSSARSPFRKPLPAADLLIHCGDLTHLGKLTEYHKCLDMLKAIQTPVKLVIAGNHDITLDRDFVFTHLEEDDLTDEQADEQTKQMRHLWTAADGRARMEGVTFLDEGLHRVDLPNGATLSIYASPYTPEFCDLGFPYEKDEDRFNTPGTSLSDAKNIAPYPVPSFSSNPIDILLTHGPAYEHLDETTRGEAVGCPHLLRALMRSRPLIHCFGHIHEGWGAERITWSENVDAVTSRASTTDEWKERGWKAGVADTGQGVEAVEVDLDAAKRLHGVFVDVSSEGGRGLRRGAETLLVNAAIMNVDYRPVNAPFVVDLDLPRVS